MKCVLFAFVCVFVPQVRMKNDLFSVSIFAHLAGCHFKMVDNVKISTKNSIHNQSFCWWQRARKKKCPITIANTVLLNRLMLTPVPKFSMWGPDPCGNEFAETYFQPFLKQNHRLSIGFTRVLCTVCRSKCKQCSHSTVTLNELFATAFKWYTLQFVLYQCTKQQQ